MTWRLVAPLPGTYGLLNLTHRYDHENPQPLEPGKCYTVPIHSPPSHLHQLLASRLAITRASDSNSVHRCQSPRFARTACRSPRPAVAPFRETRTGPPSKHTTLRPAKFQRTIERDLPRNEILYTIFSDGGDFDGAAIASLHAIELALGNTILKRFHIGETTPLSACAENKQKACCAAATGKSILKRVRDSLPPSSISTSRQISKLRKKTS